MNEQSVLRDNVHILLGGGIGAGKSAAGRRFAMLGATVVEADRVGHALLEPGSPVADEVAQRWPQASIDDTIDRVRLAAVVFADPDALAELERLTHPHIIRRIGELAETHRSLVVEVPVQIAPRGEWTHILIQAAAPTRRDRAIARGGAPDDVDRRMNRQASSDEWVRWADETIDNTGTLAELNRQVDALWHRLTAIDHEDTPG